MKLMKKNVLSILSLSAILLTGCNATNPDDSISFSEDNPVTVTWWNNYQTPDTSASGYSEESSRKETKYNEYWYSVDIIKAFEQENPGIKIATEYKGSYSDIASATLSAIEAGTAPTMISSYQDNVYKYNSMEGTYNMKNLGEELERDSDFNQTYLAAEKAAYNGEYLSLPFSKSGEMFVVNKTVFDKEGAGEAGTTVEKSYTAPVSTASKAKYSIPENMYELADLALQMKKDYPDIFGGEGEVKKDASGYFEAVPFVWDSTENMFISLMMNSGIGYTDGTKNANQALTWNCQAAKDLVIQLKKWNNAGLIATQNQLYLTNVSKGYHQYSSSMMTYGTVFMCISSTAGSRYFGTDNGFVASVNHTPNWKSGSKAKDAKVVSQGPSLTFITNKNRNVNVAASRFYKFLTNTENSAKLAYNNNYFPLRTSSYNESSIKTLSEKANTAITIETSKSDKQNYYAGSALKLNETYTSNSNYFISDVFEYSATSRTAVGNLLNTVFNTAATTDEEITTLVNNSFTTAVSAALK